MENTKQTPQEKSTLSDILEQIKIVLVIYGIVIIIHMVSIGSKLPDSYVPGSPAMEGLSEPL